MPTPSSRDKSSSVRETLRAEVAKAKSASTEPQRLGTEAELCARFGIARNTLRKALTALAEEGLIYSIPTRGWFIGATEERHRSPEPSEVAQILEEAIDSGQYAPGHKFTTAPVVAKEHGVSLHTARLALAILGTQGRIESRHGKGWYVKNEGE